MIHKNHLLTSAIGLLLFLAVSIPGLAQSLRGRVTDSRTGEGLPGVSVVVQGSNQGVSTDGQGNYVLNLNSGTYQVQYSFVGYDSQTRTVTIGNSNVSQNIALVENVQTLSDVVVVGSRSTQVRSNVETVSPVDVISARELQSTGQIEPTQMINRWPPPSTLPARPLPTVQII